MFKSTPVYQTFLVTFNDRWISWRVNFYLLGLQVWLTTEFNSSIEYIQLSTNEEQFFAHTTIFTLTILSSSGNISRQNYQRVGLPNFFSIFVILFLVILFLDFFCLKASIFFLIRNSLQKEIELREKKRKETLSYVSRTNGFLCLLIYIYFNHNYLLGTD